MRVRSSPLASLAAGTGWNAAGLVGGQAVVLVATPLLARLYSPAEFGVYAAFAGIASVLYAVAGLRFEIIVPNVAPEEAPHAALLVLLASWACAFVGSVALAAGGASALQGVFGSTALPWLLVLVILFAGATQARVYLAVRHADFRVNAWYRLLNPAIFALIALTVPSIGLAGAHVIGLTVGLVFLWTGRKAIGRSISQALVVARKNLSAPLRLLPAALLDASAVALPVVFIGSAYGASLAGEYSQVHRLVVGPLLLLAAAAAHPIHSLTARLTRAGDPVRPVLLGTLAWLSAIGLGWSILMVLAGSPVLALLLGEQWRTDQAFVVVILVSALARFVVSPASAMLLALGRHGALLAWQAALFVWVVAVLPKIVLTVSFDEFLRIFAVVESAFYLAYLFLVVWAVRKHDRACERPVSAR